MQIELSNINKIKHASIEVGGLTVITGINDSGKSTVGKALFCAIKALSSSEGDSFEYKTRIVRECIDRIYRYTRIGYSIATREKEKGREILDLSNEDLVGRKEGTGKGCDAEVKSSSHRL